MKIAIEGCCHGELDKIYDTIKEIEEKQSIHIDLLLICGDFQAVRNTQDLQSMAVPPKYRSMQDFWRYYNGEKKAPVLTIFIGGNHESSNFLVELPYGGWVAENIYYMGYSNVINYNGLRLCGISGIYKSNDYNIGRYETPPFTDRTVRSIYHVRSFDIYRLKQLKENTIDIVISHDWPRGITSYGNTTKLLQYKKHFYNDIKNNQLGSPPLEEILLDLKPNYWFAAHLHVKFSALVEHNNGNVTRFLSLDKCLPGREFLQVLDIEPINPTKINSNRLTLDPEWLCILKKTDNLLNVHRTHTYLPNKSQQSSMPTEEDIKSLHEDFGDQFEVPDMFQITAPTYTSEKSSSTSINQQQKINPQTELLCQMLGIRDPLNVVLNRTVGASMPSIDDSNLNTNDPNQDDDKCSISSEEHDHHDDLNMESTNIHLTTS
ncbi:unnamed protein product [Didymodactylos carnosus]|uniref:Lariat debranching enzyme C-terminal domain-containing protein n=1 Tax=Didymodactylos carnosus TaxID=1234261 RepID=A0A813YUQ3_9BILA|nr:unnamed protein product [Didymodactylos carnosus]CAF0956919.1 unnamed protein product [Didymodactylos carnosus]CAF3674020.1 unnamed protein product [Didymodactylos carnosus]CAF3730033.1 unnamed protein product [Didymodactylos carnosus]